MGRRAGSSSMPQFLDGFVCFVKLGGLCPKSMLQKSLQEGNPALKKLIIIEKVRDFQTSLPTLTASLRFLFS